MIDMASPANFFIEVSREVLVPPNFYFDAFVGRNFEKRTPFPEVNPIWHLRRSLTWLAQTANIRCREYIQLGQHSAPDN